MSHEHTRTDVRAGLAVAGQKPCGACHARAGAST